MSSLSTIDQLVPIEVARRFGSKDSISMVESMSETNEMLLDAVIKEASDGTINRTTQRTSLATGTRRVYGQGVNTEASSTKQIEDYIEMLEAYSEVDADMADHAPSRTELLSSEDSAFVEGMGQTQADAFLYDKRADGPEFMNGLMCRMGIIDNENVFGVENSGSNFASLLIVKWAPTMAHLFYPRGASGIGLIREWLGKGDAEDPSGKKFRAYRTFFKAHFGISVRHPKAVKRIANIIPGTTTGESIFNKVIAACNKLPKGAGNIVIYANSDVKTVFDQFAFKTYTQQARQFSGEDPWGRPVTMFGDKRVRQLDALLSTESLVS